MSVRREPYMISIGENACMWIAGNAVLMATQDVAVAERRHVGVDAALHADLGGAAFDRLLYLHQQRLDRHVVGVGLPALAAIGRAVFFL